MRILHHIENVFHCPLCEAKLLQAHGDLVKWFHEVVKPNFPDMHVSCSYRDKEAQEAACQQGLSRLEYPKSAHNKLPSHALDLFQQIDGRGVWNPSVYGKLNDISMTKGYPLLWGASFKSLGDYDHFQLKNPT